MVLKCAYKLRRCLLASNGLGMLAFRDACVSIYIVFLWQSHSILFALKNLHWFSYNYTCLWLASIKNRYSLQSKPIIRQSLCCSAGDAALKVKSKLSRHCYISIFWQPNILHYSGSVYNIFQISSCTIYCDLYRLSVAVPSNPGSGKKPTLFPGVCRVRLKVGYLDGIPISHYPVAHEVADCNRGRGGGWLWKGGGGQRNTLALRLGNLKLQGRSNPQPRLALPNVKRKFTESQSHDLRLLSLIIIYNKNYLD